MILPVPEPLARLARRSLPLYVVGGYVRNALLFGTTSGTDVDVCGPLTTQALAQALEDTEAEIIPVNPRVGTVLVRYGEGRYEYTTFRRDSYPIGGAHTPRRVQFVDTLAEDALRRDFCVNAIYMDAVTGEVIDPLGGLADLRRKVLRTTRSAAEVFGEDGLRIMRLARFAAELGFEPEGETFAVARERSGLLADISAERKCEELNRILLADVKYGVPDGHRRGVALLQALGAMRHLGLGEPRLARFAAAILPARLEVRLAMLTGEIADECGREPAAFAREALGTLRYSNATVARVCRLLEGARVPEDERDWRLWAARYGKDVEDVAPLWQDETIADRARAAWREVLAADVPFWHKDLPLTPAEVEALGVPKARLGKVMQEICTRCVAALRKPTAAECVQMIEEIKRGNLWN